MKFENMFLIVKKKWNESLSVIVSDQKQSSKRSYCGYYAHITGCLNGLRFTSTFLTAFEHKAH